MNLEPYQELPTTGDPEDFFVCLEFRWMKNWMPNCRQSTLSQVLDHTTKIAHTYKIIQIQQMELFKRFISSGINCFAQSASYSKAPFFISLFYFPS